MRFNFPIDGSASFQCFEDAVKVLGPNGWRQTGEGDVLGSDVTNAATLAAERKQPQTFSTKALLCNTGHFVTVHLKCPLLFIS